MDYRDVTERLHDDYGPRALALLAKVAEVCRAEGFQIAAEPYDMACDDYRWSMVVQRPDTELGDTDNQVDISIEIAEQREYEGGDGWGVNFGLSIVEYGGRILGELTPFNFTDLCWVDARGAERLEQRWKILEDSNLSTIPALADDRIEEVHRS